MGRLGGSLSVLITLVCSIALCKSRVQWRIEMSGFRIENSTQETSLRGAELRALIEFFEPC